MVSDELLDDVVFPEYCGDTVASSDEENCDVYITIPANAIIYQRSVESMYICMYACT